MLAALSKPFERLEQSRSELAKRLLQYSPVQLQFRPAPQTWSLTEIVHHLVLAEHFAAAYIERKLGSPVALRQLSWHAGFRSFLLTCAMRSPLRFKAPTPLVLPSPNLALSDLQGQWQELREKWLVLLERVTPEMLNLPLYRHPVAGLLTISQAVRFQQEHFNHHLQQINRILQARDFPPA